MRPERCLECGLAGRSQPPRTGTSLLESDKSQGRRGRAPVKEVDKRWGVPPAQLVRLAEAQVAPETAVFEAAGRLAYCGLIDDRFVDFGKARAAARTHALEAAITAALASKPVSPARTRAVGRFLADVE